jgi:hypothetical protein
MTDFRALCAEQAENVRYLLDCVADGDSDPVVIAECVQHLGFTRAALDEPEGGPTYREIMALRDKLDTEGYGTVDLVAFARAVLARWGNSASPAPKPIPLSERLPEDNDCLVTTTYDGNGSLDEHHCYLAKEFKHCGQVLLIWELKPTSALKLDLPFVYWLPATTRFLPTAVNPAQPT